MYMFFADLPAFDIEIYVFTNGTKGMYIFI